MRIHLRSLVVAAVCGTVMTVTVPVAGGQTPSPPDTVDCVPGPVPIDLPGTDLVPQVHTSLDAEPVEYVRWRGTVPSFDGMPLSVDVTVPCGAGPDQPAMVMAHGFTDDKTVWQETDKSDTVESVDRPATNSRWNNIWFASRGYVTVNYTARGWRDSCGPDIPGNSVANPAAQCADYEFWIHMNDKRWEIRDAQWLAGALVGAGTATSDRVAVTGGSYGGAPAIMGALLADKVVCGAAPTPAVLGVDPCAGVADGDLAPWTTPDGKTPMRWAAAVPLYTYGDLLNVLAPNGRVTDGWDAAGVSGTSLEPFGVPLEGTVSGLLVAASLFASLPAQGSNPEHDIISGVNRLAVGDPFDADDPDVAARASAFRNLKSAASLDVGGEVPVFWVQGMTDALFPAFEALTVRNQVLAADPDYPFKLFLGDIGHDYAAERVDDWDLVKAQMNDFVDHYLRPDRTPTPPVFDVGATVTRCLDPGAEQVYVSADDWDGLHTGRATLSSTDEQVTSTVQAGPSGQATDPITGATLPGPNSYKGCRIVRPAATDPTTATYEWTVDGPMVLMGGAVVDLTVSADAGGFPLAVRLWDVTADGSAQALVARGVYRTDDTTPDRDTVAFQLTPQGYAFAEGHRLRLEVTGNDSPYLQASSVATPITVHEVALTLPLLDREAADDSAAAAASDSGGPGPVVWMAMVALLGAIAVAVGVVIRRRAG